MANNENGPQPPRRRRHRLLSAVLASAIVLTGGALVWYAEVAPRARAAPARLVDPPMVVGLGWLEPAGTVVRVGVAGNPDAARVAALSIGEGDRVAEGQLLAVMDNAAQRTAAVALAEAQVRLREAQLVRLQADHAARLSADRAAADRAAADLRNAEAEHGRLRSLMAGNAATRSAYDRAVRDLALATATAKEAEAALARRTATLDGAPVDIAVAMSELETARADLAVSREALELSRVRAPTAGTVLAVRARVGERVGSDGLLDLGATDRMRAVVEVYQTDVARVRVGQAVALHAGALPGPVTGKVERVGLLVRRQTVINADPAAATDARVVEVIVALTPASSALVAALSHLQVDAIFAP